MLTRHTTASWWRPSRSYVCSRTFIVTYYFNRNDLNSFNFFGSAAEKSFLLECNQREKRWCRIIRTAVGRSDAGLGLGLGLIVSSVGVPEGVAVPSVSAVVTLRAGVMNAARQDHAECHGARYLHDDARPGDKQDSSVCKHVGVTITLTSVWPGKVHRYDQFN